ncbi:MAG TPA: DUF192 domain-containing protein [Candidatus Elarobacter sp.]|jgi:hypothetical protein|nr:DUF192 domain-containing protein [Candidatus Elarobacter sp.]
MPRVVSAGLLALAFAVLTGARAQPEGLAWCRSVPLEHAFCRALVIDAPKATLRLAVADTEARRERGLMFVASVPRDEGMIFVFPSPSNDRQEFWMKNTIAPLDMVFVDADGTVTSVAANVPATKRGTPDDKVARRQGIGRFVIELAAGRARSAGVRAGTALTIPDLDGQ